MAPPRTDRLPFGVLEHRLFKAASQGYAGTVSSLLSQGARAGAIHPEEERTALMEACLSGHADCVKALLARSYVHASVLGQHDQNSVTQYSQASTSSVTSPTLAYPIHGISTYDELVDSHGYQALQYAIQKKSLACINLLLPYFPAELLALDTTRGRLLYLVVERGSYLQAFNPAIFECLVEHGLDPNQPANPPLLYSTLQFFHLTEATDFLIRHCDVQRPYRCQSFLQMSIVIQNIDLALKLLPFSNIDYVDAKGLKALDYAYKLKLPTVIEAIEARMMMKRDQEILNQLLPTRFARSLSTL